MILFQPLAVLMPQSIKELRLQCLPLGTLRLDEHAVVFQLTESQGVHLLLQCFVAQPDVLFLTK